LLPTGFSVSLSTIFFDAGETLVFPDLATKRSGEGTAKSPCIF